MAMVESEIAHKLMLEIQRIERGTDLKRMAVISRIGMSVATSSTDSPDADAETASSSALIDLAERLSESVDHGAIREILVKAESGFVIMQFINEDFMVFGGINDLLRVGFYMEYLRNEAHKFAYILAGNKVTKELQKEISAEKDREERLLLESKQAIGADFKMDKSSSQDIESMESVLSFLKDWGSEEDAATTPDEQNVVSIDSDMMFGVDDLAPQPITQSQISSAQQISPESGKNIQDDNLEDILSLVDNVSQVEGKTETQPIISTPAIEGGGLPDDILAALDEISETTTTTVVSKKRKKSKIETRTLPYGIPVYDNEVPPIPLEDYINFEVGAFSASSEMSQSPSETSSQAQYSESDPFTTELKVKADGTPDFDAMASEYDDVDLEIEEDAMLEALAELELNDKDKNKK